MSSITEQVGRVVGGRYRLLSPIGSGASSQVFAAVDTRLGRRVAVKLLRPTLAADGSFLKRFRAEARLAASLDHPHVMRVFDWGEEAAGPYLVLEMLAGGSLRTLLDGAGRLSHAQVAAFGSQAAAGLAYAHRRGIVHRDIKPGNLLFDEEGHLRIADFGVARAIAQAALTEPLGMMFGTARYASPEQARGTELDERTDVYSLALVLYEALTGRVPFTSDTVAATLMSRIDATLPPARELGPFAPVLAAAAIPEPLARLDAASFAGELEQLARHLPPPQPLPLVEDEAVTAGIFVVDHDMTDLAPSSNGSGWSGAARGGTGGYFRPPPPPPASPVGRASPTGGRGAPAAFAGPGAPETFFFAGPGAPAAPFAFAEPPPEEQTQVRSLVTPGGGAAPSPSPPAPAFASPSLPPPAAPPPSPPSRQRGRRRRIATVAVSVLVVLALAAGGIVAAVVHYAVYGHVVPGLVRTPVAKAYLLARDAGLKLTVSSQRYSLTVPKGDVVSQSPPRGRHVKAGTAISVVESRGAAPVPVPNVEGWAQRAARSAVAAGHLVPVVKAEYSEKVHPGWVISEVPESYEGDVARGSKVVLYVSKGPQPRIVPDLLGKPLQTAEQDLAAIQLRYRVAGSGRYSTTVPAGDVYSQNPPENATARRYSYVEITLSLGPPYVSVPPLLGVSVRHAETELRNAGLHWQLYGPQSGVVVYAAPGSGRSVREGSSVTLASV